MLSFKEWLSKDSPEGAGEIWDNRSNQDLGFGRTGARSKNTAKQIKPEKSGIDPEKLFLGVSKKRCSELNKDKNPN